MTEATHWIAHYQRLLDGNLSQAQREFAEQELAYWQEQQRRQEAGRAPFRPDPLARWAVRLHGGVYRQARTI